MRSEITEAQIQHALLKHLKQGAADFAYLIGSAGTERFHAKSDIDLGIHWNKIPAFSEIIDLKEKLERDFNHEIDLIVLNDVDLIFSRQVLETGRLLFSHADGVHLQWKANQLSQYPDFKFTRAVIEKNILHRKKYV